MGCDEDSDSCVIGNNVLVIGFGIGSILIPYTLDGQMNEEDYRNVLNEIRSVIDDNTPSAFTWLSCCFLGGLVGCYGPCWLDQRARHAEEEVIRYLRRKNRESLWPLGVDISLCKLQHARFFPSPEYWLEATVDPELMRVSESEVRDMRSRLVELESNLERKSKQIDDLQRMYSFFSLLFYSILC